MDREEILKLAEDSGAKVFKGGDSIVIAGKYGSGDGTEFVMKFANAIAAHEREICAKLCDSYSGRYEEEMGALGCANAIRSRGTKGQ